MKTLITRAAKAWGLLILMFVLAGPAHAEVRLPAIIGDNMVLQRDVKVRIWGNADPREKVTVIFDKTSLHTVADTKGGWEVLLPPLKAGGPFELTIKGANVLTVKNILVGEVWLCSGQSNMEWPLVNTLDGAEAVKNANYPQIRLFTVAKQTSASPLTDVEGRWVVTTPDEAAQFSAVGYFFGRELHQQLKVPIGLVDSSWGGTPAEAWTSHEALVQHPHLDQFLIDTKVV